MESFEDLMTSALNETVAFIGTNIVYRGKTFKAVVNAVTFDEELLEGGLLSKRGISVVIPIASTDYPTVGEKLLHKGKAFRIVEIKEDEISFEVICETSSK